MTARQIFVGMMLGSAVTALPLFTNAPEIFMSLGPVIMILAMIVGGADGTLPRRI